MRQLWFCREMKIREKNKVRAQELKFRRQRLFDFEHHRSAAPYRGGGREDLCTRCTILLVGKSTAQSRTTFDVNPVPVRGECRGTRGCHRHSALVGFDLFQHSHDHFFQL